MSDFDKDSVWLGFFIGCILGIVLTALAVNYGTGKQTQVECKELDGVQVCRHIDFFPWKVEEADK